MEVFEGVALSKSGFPKSVLVDANFLVCWVSPKTSKDDKARIQYFFENVEKAKAKIIIPMPAVAEYLVGADSAALDTFNKLERRAFVILAAFDRASAFECALMDRAALGSGNKKDGIDEPWQKIKIDRQIVATGKVYGTSLVISGDAGVRQNALRVGMAAKTVQELDLPDSAKQTKLAFAPEK